MYNVGVIGCGAIFPRHLESINLNKDSFTLQCVCDIDQGVVKNYSKKLNVPYYVDYKLMIREQTPNFVSILTPNSLHVEMAIFALQNGCDVLVEKPICFTVEQLDELEKVQQQTGQNVYCVYQVRYNDSVMLAKKIIDEKLLGNIRSVSLIQRWQRPTSYYTGWRGVQELGGGVLYECGIHYIDIMQYLLGAVVIHSAKSYNVKHTYNNIEDTVYSLLDFGKFGGTLEVTIASEPMNLECSLSVQGSNGFLKLGGKAMNIIESAQFLSYGAKKKFDFLAEEQEIESSIPNSYGNYEGSCPNHPKLYSEIVEGRGIYVSEARKSIKIIEDIYNAI